LDTSADSKWLIQEFERLKLSLRVYFEDLTESYGHIFIFGENSRDWIEKTFGQVPEEGSFLKRTISLWQTTQ